MSHVATVDIEIKDLDALETACKRLGLELMRDQTTYKWYGHSVGDYPLPEGFTAEDLGNCEHAIRVPHNEMAYEVGVVRRRDGKPGWQLMWDFWNRGYGLQGLVGDNCSKLKQMYATQVATKAARMQGFNVNERVLANGSIQLALTR